MSDCHNRGEKSTLTDPAGQKCTLKNNFWDFQECNAENTKRVSYVNRNYYENNLGVRVHVA